MLAFPFRTPEETLKMMLRFLLQHQGRPQKFNGVGVPLWFESMADRYLEAAPFSLWATADIVDALVQGATVLKDDDLRLQVSQCVVRVGDAVIKIQEQVDEHVRDDNARDLEGFGTNS